MLEVESLPVSNNVDCDLVTHEVVASDVAEEFARGAVHILSVDANHYVPGLDARCLELGVNTLVLSHDGPLLVQSERLLVDRTQIITADRQRRQEGAH